MNSKQVDQKPEVYKTQKNKKEKTEKEKRKTRKTSFITPPLFGGHRYS